MQPTGVQYSRSPRIDRSIYRIKYYTMIIYNIDNWIFNGFGGSILEQLIVKMFSHNYCLISSDVYVWVCFFYCIPHKKLRISCTIDTSTMVVLNAKLWNGVFLFSYCNYIVRLVLNHQFFRIFVITLRLADLMVFKYQVWSKWVLITCLILCWSEA
jgi:hypothetical protein